MIVSTAFLVLALLSWYLIAHSSPAGPPLLLLILVSGSSYQGIVLRKNGHKLQSAMAFVGTAIGLVAAVFYVISLRHS